MKLLVLQGRRGQRRRPPRTGRVMGRRSPPRHARPRARFGRQRKILRHSLAGAPPEQRGVRKAGFVVLLGSGLGMGVSFLATPLISRIFDPAVYGSFALITGVTSVFVGVSTFRLEIQSLRVSDDTEANGLIRLGLLASCAWGVALTLAACLAMGLWDVNGLWLSAGLLVFLASLQLLGSAVLTRAREYRSLAVGNFAQGAGLAVVQLLLGLANTGAGSLLAGFGAARLGWLPALRRSQREMPGIATLWRRNRRFAALAGGSAFLNSLTTSLPVLLTSAFYGNATVGQLAIGIRMLVAPLSLVGQSAASANLGEVGRMLRRGDKGVAQLVRHGMRDLLAVGLIPCGIAGALGTWAVPLVLGREWHEAGLLLALMTAGALAQFVAAPFSQMLNMTGNNRLQLLWDIGRLLATVLSMSIPRAMGLSSGWAIGSWSVALVVVYGVSAWLTIRAIAAYQRKPRASGLLREEGT
jgi:O-antigen/teichoic acid export membrane protein